MKNQNQSICVQENRTGLPLTSFKLYAISFVLATSNVLLVLASHLINIGGKPAGKIFLPLYFFTLVGSYQYGTATGVITAALTIALSRMITGMPADFALPFVAIKLFLIILITHLITRDRKEPSSQKISVIVLGYQSIGTAIGLILTRDFSSSDLPYAWPGLLLQILGGYLFLKVFYETEKHWRNYRKN